MHHIHPKDIRALLLITTAEAAKDTLEHLHRKEFSGWSLIGLVIVDRNLAGEYLYGVPVVADMARAPEYVCHGWVDDVLIDLPEDAPGLETLLSSLGQTGVTVHRRLTGEMPAPGKNQCIQSLGDYTVLTTTIHAVSPFQRWLKRLMDIVGGLVGCVLTGILFLFLAPAIYHASPGPIFFVQERVGRNGKPFKMYKFRSMYLDAEERKAELMRFNRMDDGKMFKMDFDPRVIGNRVLPDGSHKTGIGNFIRRTSLDEFPQFFNVLRGEMSIVGTRPPLASETRLYELHHRSRLAMKPGITGMWQVNGRSDITNFEEVVQMDREYIQNWNIGMDIKILFKTVWVVFHRNGAM